MEAAGRPLPQFSPDDYVDFCVVEVVAMKVAQAKQKAERDAERDRAFKEWKKGEPGSGPPEGSL